ncbi:hypothetical protein SABIM44S_00410 [Streptomyces abikoensis]
MQWRGQADQQQARLSFVITKEIVRYFRGQICTPIATKYLPHHTQQITTILPTQTGEEGLGQACNMHPATIVAPGTDLTYKFQPGCLVCDFALWVLEQPVEPGIDRISEYLLSHEGHLSSTLLARQALQGQLSPKSRTLLCLLHFLFVDSQSHDGPQDSRGVNLTRQPTCKIVIDHILRCLISENCILFGYLLGDRLHPHRTGDPGVRSLYRTLPKLPLNANACSKLEPFVLAGQSVGELAAPRLSVIYLSGKCPLGDPALSPTDHPE